MTDEQITTDTLWAFIESTRRITGRVPKLRECVEHFDDKLLNVLMCFAELPQYKANAIRQAARDQSRSDYEARKRRQLA